MKQPALGIASSVLVICVSLGFIALFSFPAFTTWVAFLVMCAIPMQVVMSVSWHCKHPAFAAARPQPAAGILLTLFSLGVGAVVAAVHFTTVGGGINPPAPMLAMCIILSVMVTFWLTIIWGGWPFTKLLKNPVGAGFATLVAAYGINYLFFRFLFDFGFMRGAPVYVASLDPHGRFNAWSILVFCVTAMSVMFLCLNFDLWPFTKSRALMQQPVLGILWTGVILAGGGFAFYLGVHVLRMDVVQFMVRVPIPFIFGTIVLMNMMQGSLFTKLAQPLKGIFSAITSAAIGAALSHLYRALAPTVTGTLQPGPPGYDLEIWLASALLAVTFPFLIFYAEFFQMWPLRGNAKQKEAVSSARV